MRTFGRRDFLKAVIAAGGAAGFSRIIPGVWLESTHAAAPGFFEFEFGIRTVNGDQTGYRFTQELNEDSMLTAEAANDPWKYGSLRMPSIVFIDIIVSGV
jgi:hypothetical protein